MKKLLDGQKFTSVSERQSTQMSKIKNGGLDQYGAEPFKQQQFGPANVKGVKTIGSVTSKW